MSDRSVMKSMKHFTAASLTVELTQHGPLLVNNSTPFMTVKKVISGTALAFLLTAGIAAAQATGTPGYPGTTGTSTPIGTPNTGAGDIATNVALLGTSALIAIGGAVLLLRRRGV